MKKGDAKNSSFIHFWFSFIWKSVNPQILIYYDMYVMCMHSSRIIRAKEPSSDVDVKIKSYLDKAEKIRAEHPDWYEAMAKDNKKLIK
jgi:hypothetical protein